MKCEYKDITVCAVMYCYVAYVYQYIYKFWCIYTHNFCFGARDIDWWQLTIGGKILDSKF